MIGGQYIDLKYENIPANLQVLSEMDLLKTAALIESACVLGLIAAGADECDISYARDFARELGLAFQIIDDIMDVTVSEEVLGKSAGSDAENGKTTFMTYYSVEDAKAYAAKLTAEAISAISDFFRSFSLGSTPGRRLTSRRVL